MANRNHQQPYINNSRIISRVTNNVTRGAQRRINVAYQSASIARSGHIISNIGSIIARISAKSAISTRRNVAAAWLVINYRSGISSTAARSRNKRNMTINVVM